MCLGFLGHLDAPVEGRARQRQILQAAADEARDFVHALARQHEIRHAFVEIEQPLGEGGELEEIALLLDPFDRRALRTEPHPLVVEAGFALVVIGLVAHRVPAGIFVEIDVAGRLHALPDRLRGTVMARLGGADEFVVGAIEPLHHGLEARHVALDQFARRHVLLRRRLQHLDAVLVGAGEEKYISPIKPHEAGDGVGGDGLVGVADMRRAVRIGDRGGDVILTPIDFFGNETVLVFTKIVFITKFRARIFAPSRRLPFLARDWFDQLSLFQSQKDLFH